MTTKPSSPDIVSLEGKPLRIDRGPGQAKMALPILDLDRRHSIVFQASGFFLTLDETWEMEVDGGGSLGHYIHLGGRGSIGARDSGTITHTRCSWISVTHYCVDGIERGTVHFWLQRPHGQKRSWEVLGLSESQRFEVDRRMGKLLLFDNLERRLCGGIINVTSRTLNPDSSISFGAVSSGIGFYNPFPSSSDMNLRGTFFPGTRKAFLEEI